MKEQSDKNKIKKKQVNFRSSPEKSLTIVQS